MNHHLISPAFLSPPLHVYHANLPCRSHSHAKCKNRHRALVLRRMANDPFYGLTDDGDFAILGVNVEETTTDDANETGGQGIGADLLSNVISSTSFSGISGDVTVQNPSVQSVGVSKATGAGIGIGDAMSLNDALFGRLPSNDNSGKSSTMALNEAIVWDSANGDATKINDSKPPAKNAVDSGMTKDSVMIRNSEIDDADVKSVKEWLLSVIPKLNEYDIEAYSRGLINIGFHPECVTMCELKYEDLDFMKVLHQRYLYNEITGVEHPWEA